jgi:hypothetical protein
MDQGIPERTTVATHTLTPKDGIPDYHKVKQLPMHPKSQCKAEGVLYFTTGLLYVVWGLEGDIIGTQVPLPGDNQSATEAHGGQGQTKGIAPHEFRE